MLTIKEQIVAIVKDHLKTAPVELEAYLAIRTESWDAFDVVNEEQAEAGVTGLCDYIVDTIIQNFVVLEREDDDEVNRRDEKHGLYPDKTDPTN
jgi:hypothetical protein